MSKRAVEVSVPEAWAGPDKSHVITNNNNMPVLDAALLFTKDPVRYIG